MKLYKHKNNGSIILSNPIRHPDDKKTSIEIVGEFGDIPTFEFSKWRDMYDYDLCDDKVIIKVSTKEKYNLEDSFIASTRNHVFTHDGGNDIVYYFDRSYHDSTWSSCDFETFVDHIIGKGKDEILEFKNAKGNKKGRFYVPKKKKKRGIWNTGNNTDTSTGGYSTRTVYHDYNRYRNS